MGHSRMGGGVFERQMGWCVGGRCTAGVQAITENFPNEEPSLALTLVWAVDTG